jgi:hypothetical protein
VSTRQVIAYVAAVAALIAVLIVGIGLGWLNPKHVGGPPPAQPLAVGTTLEPKPAFYGDLLTAGVDVVVDSEEVSAESVEVKPSFDPYVATGPPTVTTAGVGRQETLRYRYSIQCVSEECLPTKSKPYALDALAVTVTANAGTERLAVKARWPTTFIASRLTAKDAATERFRWPKSVPTPTYAVSPGSLATWLTIAAGLLALGALALIGFEVVRSVDRRRQRDLVVLTPLEAALAYTRDAARRPDPADRRKALGLLAKTLDEEGAPALAGTAGDVAWSEEPPSPDRAIELADEVEGTAKGAR